MKELLNVLYVQNQGAFLSLENETVRIKVEGETKLRVPLLRLQGIVLFGQVSITPFLIHRCAEDGRALVWMTQHGRFRARVEGEVNGNVLLRRAQHLALARDGWSERLARQIVAGKIQNSRNGIMRSARDAPTDTEREALNRVASALAAVLIRLKDASDLNTIRGLEGEAASLYFSVFRHMLRAGDETFTFAGRTRRPPGDPTNAVLSFLYALLCAECEAALEAVGLDPQVGYLHTLRPGRPALALDLMEELRAPFADRLALTLINRRQLQAKHFETIPGGGIYLNEEGRRLLLVAYQERKAVEIEHRVLKERVPWGLVPQVQARLLARHLRGDLKEYLPFVYKV
jgi:CRISPR-associated protein Cas1